MESTRESWAGLVRRWRRSGQTAHEFAESAGVNAGTLAHWAWRLGREAPRLGASGGRPRAGRVRSGRRAARFVELIVDGRPEGGFVLELGDGWRLQIPAGFDAAALGRLLTVVARARR